MPNQPYFPTSEALRLAWLAQYLAKLPALGAICGLTTTEIAATQLDLTCYIWTAQTWNPAFQLEAQSATATKNLMAYGSGTAKVVLPTLPTFTNPPPMCTPGVFTRLFNQVTRIKASPAYTEAIGRDLGIIGSADTAEHLVPDLSVSLEQGNGQQRVFLSYTKYRHDGVYIECRRNGGDWEFLAINMVKPYEDNRPLLVAGTPEQREYRMRYWDKGDPNGEFSQVARVTVGV